MRKNDFENFFSFLKNDFKVIRDIGEKKITERREFVGGGKRDEDEE